METQKNSSKIKVKPRSRRDLRNIADTLKEIRTRVLLKILQKYNKK